MADQDAGKSTVNKKIGRELHSFMAFKTWPWAIREMRGDRLETFSLSLPPSLSGFCLTSSLSALFVQYMIVVGLARSLALSRGLFSLLPAAGTFFESFPSNLLDPCFPPAPRRSVVGKTNCFLPCRGCLVCPLLIGLCFLVAPRSIGFSCSLPFVF